jgi:hypothetical protein
MDASKSAVSLLCCNFWAPLLLKRCKAIDEGFMGLSCYTGAPKHKEPNGERVTLQMLTRMAAVALPRGDAVQHTRAHTAVVQYCNEIDKFPAHKHTVTHSCTVLL